MELRDVLVTHILGPLLLLALVARYWPISRLDAASTVAAVVAPFGFLWLAGRWHLVSVWSRHALLPAMLFVAAISWHRGRRMPLYVSNGARTWVARSVKVGLTIYVLVLTGSAIAGHRVTEPTIDLTFPLREGHFYVGQGGSTAAVNYHAVNATQRYALDIQKLTRWGNRAVRFLPTQLGEFPSYGVPVHAPCAGRVQ